MKAYITKTTPKVRTLARETNAMSSMQVALGCAALAAAVSFGLLPSSGDIADRIALQSAGDQNIDRVVTGSVTRDGVISRNLRTGSKRTYTIRRSVLQSDPNARCIIYADGTRQGDC